MGRKKKRVKKSKTGKIPYQLLFGGIHLKCSPNQVIKTTTDVIWKKLSGNPHPPMLKKFFEMESEEI